MNDATDLSGNDARTAEAPPRRGPVRVTGWAVLVGLLILSLPLGWYGVRLVRLWQTVQAIEEGLGSVEFETPLRAISGPEEWLREQLPECLFDPVVRLDLWVQTPGERLPDLRMFSGLRELTINNDATDQVLAQVADVSTLEVLNVSPSVFYVFDSGTCTFSHLLPLTRLGGRGFSGG